MRRRRLCGALCAALLALCAAAADAPLPNATALLAAVAAPPPSDGADAVGDTVGLPGDEAQLHSLLHWALGASPLQRSAGRL